jgi:hypothetical protein
MLGDTSTQFKVLSESCSINEFLSTRETQLFLNLASLCKSPSFSYIFNTLWWGRAPPYPLIKCRVGPCPTNHLRTAQYHFKLERIVACASLA